MHLDESDRLVCPRHGNERGAKALDEANAQNARLHPQPYPLKRDI